MTSRAFSAKWTATRTRSAEAAALGQGCNPLRASIGVLCGRKLAVQKDGAVAQLGERVNGIHEVSGSIPLGSTT